MESKSIHNPLDINTNPIENSQTPFISKIASSLLWTLFLLSSAALIFYQLENPSWSYKNIFRINGFTLLIWTTVLFFNAILSSYSKNYLKGFKYHQKFTLLSLGFALSVMIFVMSNHIFPLLFSWFLTSFFMAKLIGVNSDWAEARSAGFFSLKYFWFGGVLFSIGVILLAVQVQSYTLYGILEKLDHAPDYLVLISALLIIVAALIQSAIYPFHRWLLSAMTAPTPASALMHAGFVNASGILLSLFAVLLIATDTLTLIFIIGGLTAILAQFTKLLQVNVKQKLACSTIAQMGFMIMQCGLGFFNAAIAHLILHGFYKAYLFLSSGEEISRNTPQDPPVIKIKPLQAIVVLLFGLAGAFLFSFLTDKTSMVDSSIFLTLIVAITVGQATYNIVKQSILTYTEKLGISALLFTVGIIVYAIFYNAVTNVMSEMPMIESPQSLSALQITFGVIFLIGFFIMKLGVYRNSTWLYVKLLNLSQPYKQTIFSSKK
ncbi:proton-conducting transporter transmembrane domain-containing protein [Mesohalobacter halotolerans]|jgi:NAD(P)H-quinone oxidoreductase subunit 5|uniref:Pesticidal protein Cry28Aa n=1 Tax=Mesohalobacter halotolerans TaxID=1883405 RepID=A0A4U5TQB6_9FLAO|nr:proton-conducting transporter membrane subunit [Mesohalobacter halotolerans]MBS3738837.1 pesticidal protein Cry28Aa [Psychroflexus sp.]NBC57706.1 pesticidal protein Cry28Aa [Bacteroidota bacterium]TKS55534.1 pesticidal protein Cry28Aa [Mesohalobacter halotolerans]